MLILSRREGDSIIINDSIEICITEVKGEQVRLGIVAPQNVKIFRKEIYEQLQDAMLNAAQSKLDSSKLSDLQKLLQKRTKHKF